jgi:hypothetical protein
MKDWERNAGNNFCEETTGSWIQGCASPKDACLYYRTTVFPHNKNGYEIFSCPTWNLKMRLKLRFELSGESAIEEEVSLYPGRTYRWKNLTLSASPLGNPEMPVASNFFLKEINSARTAIMPNSVIDLHCGDEADARYFQSQCRLALDACTKCRIDHDNADGEIRCHCREFNAENILNDQDRNFPLQKGNLKFSLRDFETIVVEMPYVPVSVTVKVEQLTLVSLQSLDICTTTLANFSGCYKCSPGGRVSLSCASSIGPTLAEIKCVDGTNWVSPCSVNGTNSQSPPLHWQHPNIQTNCVVECPGGKTEFALLGTLMYVPPKIYGTFETVKGNGVAGFQMPHLDEFNVLLALKYIIGQFPANLIIACTIGGMLIAFYLFIKFNPVLKTYRIMLRVFVAILLFMPVPVSAADKPQLDAVSITLIAISGILIGLAYVIGCTKVIEAIFQGFRNKRTIHPLTVENPAIRF